MSMSDEMKAAFDLYSRTVASAHADPNATIGHTHVFACEVVSRFTRSLTRSCGDDRMGHIGIWQEIGAVFDKMAREGREFNGEKPVDWHSYPSNRLVANPE